MITLSNDASYAFFTALRKHDKYRSNTKKWERFVRPLINRFAKLHDCPRGQAEQIVREHEGLRRVAGHEKFVLYR